MDKINTQLYGGKGIFGGKETPLEADEIYCDKYTTCSFYKEGKCLNCRSFLAPRCRYGRVISTKGYTSRAQKYTVFKSKYEYDATYNKLKYPNKSVAVIDDMLYMNLKYVLVCKNDGKPIDHRYVKLVDGYEIMDKVLCTASVYIPVSDLTNELLYAIFSYAPSNIMGDPIKDYHTKVVPEILQDLKDLLPEIYDRFVWEYSEFNYEPNFIGKRAYINSLKPGTTFTVDDQVWHYDGTYVTTTDFNIGLSSPWYLSGGAKSEVIKIKVTDKMLIKINDNYIVDRDTKFE